VTRDVPVYALGVLCLALTGFFSPLWFLGFVPLGAGLLWASYDMVEVTSGDTTTAPRG
jgi:hypothetical protein